jgi:hypothetical protein
VAKPRNSNIAYSKLCARIACRALWTSVESSLLGSEYSLMEPGWVDVTDAAMRWPGGCSEGGSVASDEVIHSSLKNFLLAMGIIFAQPSLDTCRISDLRP